MPADLSHDLGAAERKTRVVQDMPDTDYRAADGINWSRLKDFYYRTPAHAMYSEPKVSTAFDIGSALHIAVLEPMDFDRRVVRGPTDRRGNKWKDAQDEAGDRLLLTEADYDNLLRMREAASRNTDIARLVSSNNKATEVSVFWDIGDVDCKCRFDLVIDDGIIIVDLKTTANANPSEFSKSVLNYAYHGQEAWYTIGGRHVYKANPQFLFIAIEKEPPFASVVYELDAVTKKEGGAIVSSAFEQYIACKARGEYPAYPSGIHQLTLPRWGFQMTKPGE